MAFWHAPFGAAALIAWVWGGGYLLRRAVLAHVSRRQAAANRCYVVAFLSTAAGAVAAIVVLFLVMAIGKKLVGQEPVIQVLSPTLAMAAFALLTYVVVYASFELSAAAVLRTWLRAYAPPLVLTLAVGLPVALYTYHRRHARISRQHSILQLRFIYAAISRHYLAAPPLNLQRLVDDNVLSMAELRCRTETPREIDFFYLPGPVEPTTKESQRLLACDFADNQGGRGRAVLFVNGATRWCPPEEFRRLLELQQNRPFADALSKAEASGPKPG